MFESDILLSFIFMTLLFLRQISILKQPNKINYAPLMIGIGVVSSVVHFIIYPEKQDIILLVRESLLPLLVAVLLYIVMNILHQNQQREHEIEKDEFTHGITSEIHELKKIISELEGKLITFQQDDRTAQEEIRANFKDDIKALDAIKDNQGKFLEKFDELEGLHLNVSKEFENFTEVQLPELDNVVHKHIDILRVAEQDHYNQVKKILDKAVESRCEIAEDMDELKQNLQSMKNVSDDIARAITKHTLQQLSGVTKSFEHEILSLKSHTESVKTSLYEGESTLATIRQQSEMIMKQMILSSNKMNELQKQNSGLHDIYSTIKELMADIEVIKADYVKSQAQLSVVANELKSSEKEQIEAMKKQIDSLGSDLTKKIEESLSKLHEHYHIAEEDITKSVQILAKKAQLQKGYTGLDS